MRTKTLTNFDRFSSESSEQSLTDILLGYLQTNLDFDHWQKFLRDPIYISLQRYDNKYKDAMFHDLVNLGSTYLSIKISELLEGFILHKLDQTLSDKSESACGCLRSNIEEFISYGII